MPEPAVNLSLPAAAQRLLQSNLNDCRNLGLILDKFAPWGQDQRGTWDLVMRQTIRRQLQDQVVTVSSGEAKGLWLSKSRRARGTETQSLFEVERTDTGLMQAHQRRWQQMIKDAGGIIFQMPTAERMAAGLGASHVLETGLTLERNTGLPYLPGSTVKGLARAWGLIVVASNLGITLEETSMSKGEMKPTLNILSEILISASDDALLDEITKIKSVTDNVATFVQGFRFIFGSQANAGAIAFTDAIYFDSKPPEYATDVMTPHYVDYYTNNGSKPPTESDSPNPVSFITVDKRNMFAFGLIPRQSAFRGFAPDQKNEQIEIMLGAAQDWLVNGLTRLGAGSKTAAGYGFFSAKQFKQIHPKGK